MNDLMTPILELQRMAHDLMYLGADDAPIYSDDFTRLNKSVQTQSDALYSCKGRTVEEEANLCLALLMGYNATIYDDGRKDKKKQSVLDRSWEVLSELAPSLLKVRLLTYCYAEVYEEDLIQEARAIIHTWKKEELTLEQIEIIEELNNIEENQYPFEVLEE